jgi:hypothetical protein
LNTCLIALFLAANVLIARAYAGGPAPAVDASSYAAADDDEVAAAFAEAEAAGLLIACVRADTPSGCRE